MRVRRGARCARTCSISRRKVGWVHRSGRRAGSRNRRRRRRASGASARAGAGAGAGAGLPSTGRRSRDDRGVLPTDLPPRRWTEARCIAWGSMASGWRVMIGMATISAPRVNAWSAAGQRCVPGPTRCRVPVRVPRPRSRAASRCVASRLCFTQMRATGAFRQRIRPFAMRRRPHSCEATHDPGTSNAGRGPWTPPNAPPVSNWRGIDQGGLDGRPRRRSPAVRDAGRRAPAVRDAGRRRALRRYDGRRKTYPTPRTVWMNAGCPGSSSIWLRSQCTWTSTVRVSPA